MFAVELLEEAIERNRSTGLDVVPTLSNRLQRRLVVCLSADAEQFAVDVATLPASARSTAAARNWCSRSFADASLAGFGLWGIGGIGKTALANVSCRPSTSTRLTPSAYWSPTPPDV